MLYKYLALVLEFPVSVTYPHDSIKKSLFITTILAFACLSGLSYAGTSYYEGSPQIAGGAVPPHAVAGQCYARVKVPAQYNSVQETVLVEDSYETLSVTPPQLQTRQEQVVVKDASTRYEVRQPRYETRNEQILVAPAYEKLSVSQPSFKKVIETFSSSQPQMVWKRGNPTKLAAQGYKIHSTASSGGVSYGGSYSGHSGGGQCLDACEIWCLVEVPGETIAYERTVLDQPAQVMRMAVDAKYQTIRKQVLVDPGGVSEIPVPAEYQSVSVEELVAPGYVDQTTVPAKYGYLDRKELISAETYEWKQVICKPGTGTISFQTEPSVDPSPFAYSSSSSASSEVGHYGGSAYNSGSITSYNPHTSSYGTTSHSSYPHNIESYESSRSYESSQTSSCSSSYSGEQIGQSQSLGTYYYGSDKPVH